MAVLSTETRVKRVVEEQPPQLLGVEEVLEALRRRVFGLDSTVD